jgi:hypothetical protein
MEQIHVIMDDLHAFEDGVLGINGLSGEQVIIVSQI